MGFAMSFADDILDGLNEFKAAVDGDRAAAKRLTWRKVKLNLKPTEYAPELVRETRQLLGTSQSVFAEFLGVSVQAVQAWEQGVNPVGRAPARLMDEIRHDPDYWRARLLEMADCVS